LIKLVNFGKITKLLVRDLVLRRQEKGHMGYRGSVRIKFCFIEAAVVALTALLVSACLNNGTQGGKAGSSLSSGTTSTRSGSSGSTSTVTTESQCTIFSGSSTDYSTCIACKNSLCGNCAIAASCSTAELAACSVNSNLLVQCVHENVSSVGAGGRCVGLRCGDGQIADFTTCACKDGTPPTSFQPAPGYDDQLTPYLQPGFSISNNYCGAAQQGTLYYNPAWCLEDNFGLVTTYKAFSPTFTSQPPVNVIQDVGYVRWDLAMDASQYSPVLPLMYGRPFMGSWSSLNGKMTLYYQLKPNTELNIKKLPNTRKDMTWTDCVEHFSGYKEPSGSAVRYPSTLGKCIDRASTVASAAAPAAIENETTFKISDYAGSVDISSIALNGMPAHQELKKSAVTVLGKGTAQIDNLINTTSSYADLTNSGGLFSNIGYYKYTWDNIFVRRKGDTTKTDIASGGVTGIVALNTNLGYTPASMVESSAMSPEAVTNTVGTIDCSTTANPHPCVTTALYRAPGGAILSQSFSPRYGRNSYSSVVSALPPGVTAVSTPKLIEDTSQWPDKSTSGRPARLRTFVRAADGNVYMSRLEQGSWRSWMNLGRPWVCDTGSLAYPCKSLADSDVSATAFAPVLAPFQWDVLNDMYSAGGLFTPPGNATLDSTSANDGISIAGEPVVVSYMPSPDLSSSAAIAVLVRVSQLRSSTGLPGPLHNSVFYTVAMTSTAKVQPGQQLEFDKIRKWSPWMPILINDATVQNIWKIQGNPTAFIQPRVGTNTLQLYALATKSGQFTDATSAFRNSALHPPIAPADAAAPYGAGSYGTTVYTGAPGPVASGTFTRWFNYGTSVETVSLELSANNLTDPNGGTALDAVGYSNYFTSSFPVWQYASATNKHDLSDMVIVSDWSWSNLTTANKIRAFASVITGRTCNRMDWDTAAGNTITPAPTWTGVSLPLSGNVQSPCYYVRQTAFVEFELTNVGFGAGNASGLSQDCAGAYKVIKFQGNIGVDPNLATRISANTAVANATPTVTTNRLFLAGRAVCPDHSKCDPVNPTVAIASVSAAAHCMTTAPTGQVMYYAGLSAQDTASATYHDNRILAQTYVTSDVIMSHSYALDTSSADLPVFLLTRSNSGNITHGVFGSFVNGTWGAKFFNFFQMGGYTN